MSSTFKLNPLAFFASPLLPFAFGLLLMSGLAMTGCTKSYPNCDDDKTCREHGEVCVDGTCRQCASDAHCKAIDACLVCSANECVKQVGCCKSDLDCPTGKCFFAEGSNVGQCASECSADRPCPSGQRCSGGSCIADECSADRPCPSGQRCDGGSCVAACDLENILFDFDERSIRLDQERIARANAECISGASAKVRTEGHADERGSDEYNLVLGERRATSVHNFYKRYGVSDSLLERPVSYGEERPICNQASESCWKQNRRVETVFR